MLYCHMQIHIYIYTQHHNDTGELTKYLSASSDTKKTSVSQLLCPHGETIFSRHGPRQVRDNTHVSNNWYQQLPQRNRPDSTSAENIDSPMFTNIEKVYAHSSDKPPMCEIPGQPNRRSRNSISRVKILISNPPVQNMKTFPKSVNYRYAGFQILD